MEVGASCPVLEGNSSLLLPKNAQIVSVQLHGFSDASESAYAGVVYLRMVDTNDVIHISLVRAKTKVETANHTLIGIVWS